MTELIGPGIPVDAHLYKAQLFIDMLCTKIVEICIQPDQVISKFMEEAVHQQAQTDFPRPRFWASGSQILMPISQAFSS